MAGLVGDIISDVQQLVRQEMTLARTEIEDEWLKLKAAMLVMVSIAIFAVVSVGLIAQTLAHAISELASEPLWLGYGITSLTFMIGAVALYLLFRHKLEIHFVPRQTVQSIKENLRWIKKRT
jgi:hypothetical protein